MQHAPSPHLYPLKNSHPLFYPNYNPLIFTSTNVYTHRPDTLLSANILHPSYTPPTIVDSLILPTTLPIPYYQKPIAGRHISLLNFLYDAQPAYIFNNLLLCFDSTKIAKSSHFSFFLYKPYILYPTQYPYICTTFHMYLILFMI